MSKMIRGAMSAGLLLLAAGALTACSSANDAVRDAGTGEVTEAGTVDVFALTLGDCFNDDPGAGEELSSLPVTPCDTAHDNELYFEFDMPDGDFPSQEEFDAAADAQCIPAFESYVGIAYADSELDYWYLSPTADGWEQIPDRTVQCAVWDPSGKLSGSAKGTAR